MTCEGMEPQQKLPFLLQHNLFTQGMEVSVFMKKRNWPMDDELLITLIKQEKIMETKVTKEQLHGPTLHHHQLIINLDFR